MGEGGREMRDGGGGGWRVFENLSSYLTKSFPG